jgi:winged helix-turn helix protein
MERHNVFRGTERVHAGCYDAPKFIAVNGLRNNTGLLLRECQITNSSRRTLLGALHRLLAVQGKGFSGKREQRIAMRACIVLGAADGRSNSALAAELNTSRPTIIDWRRRFSEGGIESLYEDRPRGRSFKPLTPAKEAEIVTRAQSAPPDATQWSCRSAAKLSGISKASVQRVWHAKGLKPHLVKTFKLSNDPNFAEKLQDVIGLI